MDLSSHFLGQTAILGLQQRLTAPVLTIGKDRFTRTDLARGLCFNFVAAAALDRAIADLHVKSTRDLFEKIAPRDLALPRVGTIALAVLGAAFELQGLGGATPLDAWVSHHHDPARGHRERLTFATFKHAAAKRDRPRTKKK